jgi:hypothetical protein
MAAHAEIAKAQAGLVVVGARGKFTPFVENVDQAVDERPKSGENAGQPDHDRNLGPLGRGTAPPAPEEFWPARRISAADELFLRRIVPKHVQDIHLPAGRSIARIRWIKRSLLVAVVRIFAGESN